MVPVTAQNCKRCDPLQLAGVDPTFLGADRECDQLEAIGSCSNSSPFPGIEAQVRCSCAAGVVVCATCNSIPHPPER